MDHGPETKKARLSTSGSPWAPSSGPSPAINAHHPPPSSSSSSHHYQPYQQQQQQQQQQPQHYHHPSSLPNPSPYPPAYQQYLPQQQQQQQQHQPPQHGRSPRLPSPRPYSPRHSPRHSPHYTLQHQQHQQQSAGPYQPAHPSASSPSATAPPPGTLTNGPVPAAAPAGASTTPAPTSYPPHDQLPPIASSPAPPTPVSAHSYTHTTTLPPPPPGAHNGANTNGRLSQHRHSHSNSNSLSQPRTYQPHPDDRRQHDQDAYTTGQDHRQQDYRQQQQIQQQPSADYSRQDYRFPTRSPAGTVPGLPPPESQPNRPGSAASLGASRNHQQPPPTDDNNARSMSFENLAHPNMGAGQPPPPYPSPYSAQQQMHPPQHQQQPHQQHGPPQHSHQPYHPDHPQHPQQSLPLPPPPQHAHGPMQPGAPPPIPSQHSSQSSTSLPSSQQGPNAQFRPPSYPQTTPPVTMGHQQQPLQALLPLQQQQPPPPQQQHQNPSPSQQVPPLQPHLGQQPSPQQQQPPPPPPPQALLQPQHFEQPQQTPQPMFNHAPSVPPPSGDILYPLAYATAGKKKAQRASQACDSCRSLKAKCDETKPCKNCREKNIECKYRDPIPKQQDKVSADILDSINVFRGDVDGELRSVRNDLSQEMRSVRHDISQIMQAVQQIAKAVTTQGAVGLDAVPNLGLETIQPAMDTVEDLAPVAVNEPSFEQPVEAPGLSSNEAERITREMQGEFNTVSQFSGPGVKPDESAIPSNHTTLAGLLLTWPTIRERVQHLLQEQGIKNALEYPIRQEEQRGHIRTHGRGEGFDQKMTIRNTESGPSSQPESAAMERGASNLSNNSSGGSYDDGSDFVRYPGEIWGQLGGWGNQLGGYASSNSIELDLEPKTVWMYVKSYEQNIQNMHPLIWPKPLHAMVTLFLDTLPRATSSQAARATWSASRPPVASFAGTPDLSQGHSPTAEGSLKRKRSPFPESATGSTPVAPMMPLRPGMPFRNVESALVLSILALGKICLYKHGRLPDVLPENLDPAESSPPGGWQGSHPSPAYAEPGVNNNSNSLANNNGYSPAPSFQDSPLASPAMGFGNTPSRRTSTHTGQPQTGSAVPWSGTSGPVGGGNYVPPGSSGAGSVKGGSGNSGSTAMRRNLDEIPGLDYFAAACEIMANHPTGRELKHVWVHILACLYYGQLGRPIDSLESVARAGRVLLATTRPSMSRYRNIQDTLIEYAGKLDDKGQLMKIPESRNVQHRDNPYLLAYWSCLQLESDILAELHLPPSGILTYEKHFPYPRLDLLAMHGIEQQVLESYNAQLYLRNQLNDIHKTLYHGDINGAPNSKQIEMYSAMLSTHSWVPVRYAFQDTDPPPNEILHARLRAKYWGAQVIVHRFYVRRILEHNFNRRAKREERRRKREENGDNGEESDDDDDEFIEMGKVDEDVKKVIRMLSRPMRDPQQVLTASQAPPAAEAPQHIKASVADESSKVFPPAPAYPLDPNAPQELGPDGLPIGVDAGPFSPISIMLARRGIQALIESTRAFHGLPDRRFIITNVFGTAHAQWGNLLILDSIQRDPVLGRYISEELVNDLFRKTIAFFEVVSQPSSALGYDLRILKGLYAMRMGDPVCIEQAKNLSVTQGLPNEHDEKLLAMADPSLKVLNTNMYQMLELFPDGTESPPANTIQPQTLPPTQLAQQQAQQPPQPQQPYYGQRVSPLGPPPLPNSAPVQASSGSILPPPSSQKQQPGQYPMFQEGSPMQMSPMAGSPTSPASGHRSGGSSGGGGLPSPGQARLPGMQYGPPPVKTPTTPNESGFPHHLPNYERRPFE